jgi:hypothetical protein
VQFPRTGAALLAFGYDRQTTASSMSFTGFNQEQHHSVLRPRFLLPSDLSDNVAYQLYLADVDTVTGRFHESHYRQGDTVKVMEGGDSQLVHGWGVDVRV